MFKPMNTTINQQKLPQTIFYQKGIGTMLENVPDIMTFKECKDTLKIGKNTLLDLIHDGQIEAFKIGNRWKIPREALISYLQHF